jgi:hypothetical protein
MCQSVLFDTLIAHTAGVMAARRVIRPTRSPVSGQRTRARRSGTPGRFSFFPKAFPLNGRAHYLPNLSIWNSGSAVQEVRTNDPTTRGLMGIYLLTSGSIAFMNTAAASGVRSSRATSRFAHRPACSEYSRADELRFQPQRHEVESAATPRFQPRAAADESAARFRARCKGESRESVSERIDFNYGRQSLNRRIPRFQRLIAIDELAARAT